MDWLTPIIDFFSGSGGALSSLESLFQTILQFVTQVAQAIYSVLTAVANVLLTALKAIGSWIETVWNKFFKGIFNRIFNVLLKAHDWLEAHLGPILRFLEKLRALLDRIYYKYIQPFLNLIQHIRRFLLILKLLHIKWAQQLDAKLLSIETQVAQGFLKVRGTLGQLIDVVNLIIDPSVLIRKPHIIVSIRRSIPGIFRALTGTPIGFWLPSNSLLATAEEKPVGCSADPWVLVDVPGIPFPIPYPTSDTAGYFNDGDTGVAADQLADFTPLAWFDENYLRPRKCLTDQLAAADLATSALDALRNGTGSINSIASDSADLFNALITAGS